MKTMKQYLILVVGMTVAALAQPDNSQTKATAPQPDQAKIQPGVRGGKAGRSRPSGGGPDLKKPRSPSGKGEARRSRSSEEGVWDDTDIVHVKPGHKQPKGPKASGAQQKGRK